MPGSIHVGTIAGIKIYISFSWLIILVLLTVSLAIGWFPLSIPGLATGVYYVLGFIAAILLFASVLVHELAHSLVARARGLPVKSISLFIFGGVSNIEREPRNPGTEFQMAIVGPIASIVIGVISYVIALAVGGSSRPIFAILAYLGVANVLLGLFNLIPGFPLDGGRVLRSIIWKVTGSLRTATRWAARVGMVVAFLFILWGIWQVFTGNLFGGIWIGFIGWFLLSASQSANTETALQSLLQGVRVADVMRPVTASAPVSLSLRQLTDGYLLPMGLRAVPVVQDERLVGLVTLAEVRGVPRERWDTTLVSQVMIPLDRLHTVSPEQSLNDALPMLVSRDVNQAPVVQDGRLVGMLSREMVMRYLEVRRSLGPDEAERRPINRAAPPFQQPDATRPREPV